MHKLASLREHLIGSPLQIKDSQLQVYATAGGVRSGASSAGRDFEISYTAHVLLEDWTGDPDALFYLVLGWLDKTQPNHSQEAIEWEADLLNHRSADVYIAVQLTETVTAVAVAGGVELQHCDDPSAEAVLLPADQWTLYVNDNELTTWTNGG